MFEMVPMTIIYCTILIKFLLYRHQWVWLYICVIKAYWLVWFSSIQRLQKMGMRKMLLFLAFVCWQILIDCEIQIITIYSMWKIIKKVQQQKMYFDRPKDNRAQYCINLWIGTCICFEVNVIFRWQRPFVEDCCINQRYLIFVGLTINVSCLFYATYDEWRIPYVKMTCSSINRTV